MPNAWNSGARAEDLSSSKIDYPSLLMVTCLTANLVVSFFYPTGIGVPREFGVIVLVCGFLIFGYVLIYLRRGFFGETKPVLDHLVTNGPYRFCRHPLYLSFIAIVLGIDLLSRSAVGVVFTLVVSVPSVVYRAKVEDRLLREKFGEEWKRYADKVGFLLPMPRRLTRPSAQYKAFLLVLVLFVPVGFVADLAHEFGHAPWGMNASMPELGQALVSAGTYTELRLKVASAKAEIGNKTNIVLEIPSGLTSGLKIDISPAAVVEKDRATTLLLTIWADDILAHSDKLVPVIRAGAETLRTGA